MASKQAIVELTPSRLTVSTLRSGKVVDSRTLRFDRAEWPPTWTSSLPDFADQLKAMVDELRCAGSHTTIIYSAPGSLASVTSCPSAAGIGNAERAARLALANVADFPIEISPTGTASLLNERMKRRSGESWVPNCHVLAASDSEDRTQPLCDWAEQAGLQPMRVLNAECVALADAVSFVTAPKQEGVKAVLWLGEHCAVLAAGVSGRLLFVRTLNAGSEMLAEALTSSLRPAREADPPVHLTRQQARDLLMRVGVPAPDQDVPGHSDLVGASLLPHLQPLIQRLSIEAKQSLRFGVPDMLRPGVKLTIIGAGAAIPRLGDVVSRAAGVPFEASTDESAARSLTQSLVRHPKLPINVAPSEIRAIGAARKMRSALVAGVAIAAMVVAGEYIMTGAQISKERARLTAANQASQGSNAAALTLQRAINAQTTLTAIDARVNAALAEAPCFAEFLAQLSTAPPSIRLSSIELASDGKNGNKATLLGKVSYREAPDASAQINRFITELSAMPIVESARLGNTQRSTSDGFDTQAFEISIALLSIPAASVRADIPSTPPALAPTPPTTGQPASPIAGAPTP